MVIGRHSVCAKLVVDRERIIGRGFVKTRDEAIITVICVTSL